MLNVKVDRQDPTDLYEQVAGEIRRAIADGEAKPGERLHPPRTSPPSSGSTPTPCCAPRAATRRGTARVPPRPRHPGRRNTRTRRRRPTRKGARRLRPQPGLPPRRAGRDHRRRRLARPSQLKPPRPGPTAIIDRRRGVGTLISRASCARARVRDRNEVRVRDEGRSAKSLLEPRVVAYGRKVVVFARVFPEPR